MIRISFAAFVLLCLAVPESPADAAFTFTLSQDGDNVVGSGSGSIDTFELIVTGPGSCGSGVTGDDATEVSCSSGTDTLWQGTSGPVSFGSGAFVPASSATGDDVGIVGGVAELETPEGYVSGSALSDTLTFDNTTISALGLTPGTYTYTWGAGADADSYTVDIEAPATAVPEPGSLALLGSALALLASRRRRGRTARGELTAMA